ncbi:YfiR family protein [Ramlibacter sp. AN1015]|uniref:YfiR family protein n=1 Tax=Ramlibacter sp. AN1015 TaxID=3133428 RepID=UPI0030BC97FA
MIAGPTTPTLRWRLYALACVAAGLLTLAWAGSARAQAETLRSSAVKAAFLYRFTNFVEWPRAAFSGDAPLVIAVWRDPEIADDLEVIVAGRTAQGRPVVVRRVQELAAASGAHVLFFGRGHPRLREALASAPGGPTLLVTAEGDAHPPGSALNLERGSDGRVRFTASPDAAAARGLHLSARLLSSARAVEGRAR